MTQQSPQTSEGTAQAATTSKVRQQTAPATTTCATTTGERGDYPPHRSTDKPRHRVEG